MLGNMEGKSRSSSMDTVTMAMSVLWEDLKDQFGIDHHIENLSGH